MRPRAIAALLSSAALFCGAAALIFQRQLEAIRSNGLGVLAFRDIIYYPVRAFLEGVNPYDAANYLSRYPAAYPFPPYLPSTLLLHLPFGLLPLGVSAVVYEAVSLGLTVLLGVLALKLNGFRPRAVTVLLVSAIVLLSPSGRENLFLGEVTLQVGLAAYVALAYARRRPWVSGLGLAVTMFKPTYGVPLGLLMLARRDRQAILSGAVLTLALNLPVFAILVHHAGGFLPFVRQFHEAASGFQAWIPANDPATSPYRVDAIAFVSRLIGHSLDGPEQFLLTACLLGIAAIAVRKSAHLQSEENFGIWAGLILTTVVFTFYHQRHDLFILVLPLLALARRPLPGPLCGHHVPWLLLLPLLVLFTNYAGGHQVLTRLGFLVPIESSLALAPRPGAVLLASINGAALLVLFAAFVRLAWVATPQKWALPSPSPPQA
jgi:hypothetical protein